MDQGLIEKRGTHAVMIKAKGKISAKNVMADKVIGTA
jgi:hypothetical protein